MAQRSSGFFIGVAFAIGVVVGVLLPRPWLKTSPPATPTADANATTEAPQTDTFESALAAGNKAMDEKRYADAVVAYDRALAIRFDPDVATDRGVSLREQGQHELALAAFEFVTLRVPTHWQARYNRAVVLLQMGRADDARNEAERLAKEQPENPSVQALVRAIPPKARP